MQSACILLPLYCTFYEYLGAKATNSKLLNYSEVENFYELFITDEIFEHISEQTNLYSLQSRMVPKRLRKWQPTNKYEIKRLFGLILWMELVKLPSVHLY
jgi:hypothetical protein